MRRGFTLVELLVASAAATILILMLYGSLVFYSRAYTREDEALERSRRAQEILGLMRDDFERAEGDVQPETLGDDEGLKAVGFQGRPEELLGKPRRAVNIINAFTNLKAQKPYLSKRYALKDAFIKGPQVNGFTTVVRDINSCIYVNDVPPTLVRKTIGPIANTTAIVHIPEPFDKPRCEYLVMRKVVGGVVAPVIWAFHREKTGKLAPGTLLRWTEATGVKSIGGDQLVDFQFDLECDCPYADPVPPKRPAPWFLPMKDMATLKLVFGGGRLAAQDPGFTASATFLLGP